MIKQIFCSLLVCFYCLAGHAASETLSGANLSKTNSVESGTLQQSSATTKTQLNQVRASDALNAANPNQKIQANSWEICRRQEDGGSWNGCRGNYPSAADCWAAVQSFGDACKGCLCSPKNMQ